VLIPLNVYGVLRSGSRAGLLTLVSGLIMFMVYGSKKQRAALLVACFAGLALSTVYLPDKVKDRLTDWFAPGAARAFFAPESAERASVESDQDIGVTTAEASSEARLYLLRRSLILTAKNPIFGVGPDQFPEAETRDAEENGGHGLWHASHNTYTQMSSETGIAGLVLFVGALYWSYSGLSAIRKNGPTREIRQIALFLQTAYFMLLVGAFFLSLGYGGLLFAMIGFSAAFKRAVRSYVEDSNPQALQPKMRRLRFSTGWIYRASTDSQWRWRMSWNATPPVRLSMLIIAFGFPSMWLASDVLGCITPAHYESLT
jgi:O-antigen ligase